MGCDIHGWVEKKVGDKWIARRSFNGKARERNYKRFGLLANVRTDGPEPKGLPLDISDSANLDADEWGNDGHSHSWLVLEEAIKAFVESEFQISEFEHKYPASAYFDIDCSPEEFGNYRIVFWFDN